MFALVVAAALGSGLVGGVLLAFSVSVMPALARQPDAHGLRAMQAINVVILNPLFLTLFMGTAALSVGLLGLSVSGAFGAASGPAAAGGVLYLAGAFGITMVVNVPLNNRLAKLDANAPGSGAEWRHYLARWTRWNHVRSAAAGLGSLTLILAAAKLG